MMMMTMMMMTMMMMTIDKNRSLYTKWHFQCEKVQKRVLHKRRTWKGRMPETATPALLWKSLFKMLLAVFVLMVLLYAIIVKESCAYREPFLKDKWTNYEQRHIFMKIFRLCESLFCAWNLLQKKLQWNVKKLKILRIYFNSIDIRKKEVIIQIIRRRYDFW